jgi:hypothetical protein
VALDAIPVYLRAGAVVPAQLNPALEFGRSMSSNRVNALVITPTKTKETISLLDEHGQEANAIARPTADGFALTLKDLSQTEFLLVYGANLNSVIVDGKILPQLEQVEFASMPAGWSADSKFNRAVIRLPGGQSAKMTKPSLEVEVKFQGRR